MKKKKDVKEKKELLEEKKSAKKVKKREKNQNSLEAALDYATKKCGKFIQKIATKEKEHWLFLLVRLCLIFLYFIIVRYLVIGFQMLGILLIYLIASTFREILSCIWCVILNYGFIVFILYTLDYEWHRIIDKEEFAKLKKKVGTGVENAFHILNFLLVLPLFMLIIGVLFIFGILVYLHTKGIYLMGIYFMLAGIFLMLISLFLAIYRNSTTKKKEEE